MQDVSGAADRVRGDWVWRLSCATNRYLIAFRNLHHGPRDANAALLLLKVPSRLLKNSAAFANVA